MMTKPQTGNNHVRSLLGDLKMAFILHTCQTMTTTPNSIIIYQPYHPNSIANQWTNVF